MAQINSLDVAPKLTDLQLIIQSLLAVAARLIGIAAFVMLIVGGFQMLTASGDPKKTEQGQKTITAAIVGIAIVVGGWFALTILEQLTGAKITILNLCFTPNCQ